MLSYVSCLKRPSYLLVNVLTQLRALVIETLREENKHRPQIPCVYFYFDAVNDGLTYADIWAILLEQLLRHENSSEAAKKLTARYDKPSQYSSSLNPK